LDATNDLASGKNWNPRDAFVIGKIARLFKLKGHEDLLLAFSIGAAAMPARPIAAGR